MLSLSCADTLLLLWKGATLICNLTPSVEKPGPGATWPWMDAEAVQGSGFASAAGPTLSGEDTLLAPLQLGSRVKHGPRSGQIAKQILPTIAFFLAIQFHATLECVVVGVQVDATNFWILLAGVSIHKVFVSTAFGVKMYNDSKLDSGSNRYLLVMGLLWIVLPALCVLVGYFATGGVHPMTSLVLSSLAGGTFIYIGGFEILGQEFGHGNARRAPHEGTWGRSVYDHLWKLGFTAFGIALVAALSALPQEHD